jgi:predicted nuclease with TOPRIM domain
MEDRISELENNLAQLRLEFEELKSAFYDLKRQWSEKYISKLLSFIILFPFW